VTQPIVIGHINTDKAATANTPLVAADYKSGTLPVIPGGGARTVNVTVVYSAAAKISAIIAGTARKLNADAALVANSVYGFSFQLTGNDSINFQFDTNGNVNYLLVTVDD
jgi:hypothetical protein